MDTMLTHQLTVEGFKGNFPTDIQNHTKMSISLILSSPHMGIPGWTDDEPGCFSVIDKTSIYYFKPKLTQIYYSGGSFYRHPEDFGSGWHKL